MTIEDILSDLKREVHNNTVHSYTKGVDSYIYVKVFDAILQKYINKIMKEKQNESNKD